ncbi:HWE histidine kinase domain-containing protein [Novosphingobium sp. JCM 18896]|uniref:HWE histidine kinase domain-containing protein n=1 Tax=Novosphingobium sp. JCM 18896 TaxID=2989731 RepID=UPI002223E6D3|nr:HWE histidine kinase domain-containing protein [Novosphingobium sp. JCM 18896]MCW1427590.1 GAF domain-containing protein [Novosphingobium sp. JCM 18896]
MRFSVVLVRRTCEVPRLARALPGPCCGRGDLLARAGTVSTFSTFRVRGLAGSMPPRRNMAGLLQFKSDERMSARGESAQDDLSDIELLHSISVALIGEQDRLELYGKIVDAAVSITGSQFGTMQLLCPPGDPSGHGGELNLLCSRGLPTDAVAFWQWVSPAAHSSCTAALKTGRRAIIPDFEKWQEIAGTEDLIAFRRTGIRSAQTTPLLSRGGELLGMISTHWSEPHEPTERDLRLLDILARQAADLLERTIAEEKLREREQELKRNCAVLRETEALQRMLTGELSHRVKNMLATVQAIASQTLRNCEDPAEFVESFGGRIQSMSRVHSQLSTNEWKATQLHDVVRDQMKLGPVDETQISATGPNVDLGAAIVPQVAMILHELGTNSLKYGALSASEGSVSIDWSVSGQTLKLRWAERGGPSVNAPIRRGFGTRLIEASARGIGGDARMSIDAGGVRWNITLTLPIVPSEPLAADMSEKRAQASGKAQASLAPGARLLEGKRILVVEDEPLLALEVAAELEMSGAFVVGPAGNLEAAMKLIEQYRFHGALLDANLGGQGVDDIATRLAEQGIPFAFVSGYDRSSLPDAFRKIPLLGKPFDRRQLLDAAVALVT